MPPLRLARGDSVQEDIFQMVARQSRTPSQLNRQLRSQIAGLRATKSRLVELLEEHGPRVVKGAMQVHDVEVPLTGGTLSPNAAAELIEVFGEVYKNLFGTGSGFREGGIEITGFQLRASGLTWTSWGISSSVLIEDTRVDLEKLEGRLKRLEDRESIRELVARYGQVVDDRDIAGIEALFTPDAIFRSRRGEMHAVGLAAVMDNFRGRFEAMTASNHFVHDHIITFDNDDEARGFVTSHAEVVREGVPLLVAMRYDDRYRRIRDRWKFVAREVSFFYYVPASRYAELLPTRERVYGYGEPVAADWPEGTPTYARYENNKAQTTD